MVVHFLHREGGLRARPCYAAGVSPWRRMISASFVRSGGPPALALSTSNASRKWMAEGGQKQFAELEELPVGVWESSLAWCAALAPCFGCAEPPARLRCRRSGDRKVVG